ncbi:unnamed protein product [Nezara viridula]|uniref:Uncharacterized protein n=1 Tax=Nezara viridula TaxID=85310 RepID=A0A9P0MSK2_NEZVI|nr:unnamed protein product [Nezara viridula]
MLTRSDPGLGESLAVAIHFHAAIMKTIVPALGAKKEIFHDYPRPDDTR